MLSLEVKVEILVYYYNKNQETLNIQVLKSAQWNI